MLRGFEPVRFPLRALSTPFAPAELPWCVLAEYFPTARTYSLSIGASVGKCEST
jgi:hypothetical protein